jgi:hypothetical protein
MAQLREGAHHVIAKTPSSNAAVTYKARTPDKSDVFMTGT